MGYICVYRHELLWDYCIYTLDLSHLYTGFYCGHILDELQF